ncbi:MAG: rhodanese domain-containing protein [Candidatus Magnetoglobus multicellularis str. Araruama]|uniref:Rhodanese domain-containing protein n=1 Tax=Candidatus Magnetoglobus multicellularis str. Araruama TaxID=890399 RepID=A0A1V1PDQ9_9BACT|nr:MAG: rhodanese domain-containing protein [Candidatus Magnetoglobus multicellularis str. Araruama]
MKLGYTDVYCFRGGIPEWRSFSYPMVVNEASMKMRIKKLKPKKLAKLMKKTDIFVVDVRPKDFKRDSSFIIGSIHCPLLDLTERYHEFPKDKQIVLTDWAMRQSPLAAKYLINEGYPVIGVLKGGIERWKHDNLPVENR